MAGQSGWIHPRMDEVLRRRDATNFDNNNVRAIALSSAIIVVSFFVPNLLHRMFVQLPGPSMVVSTDGSSLPPAWLHAIQPYPNYALWLIRLVFTLSIGVALIPLLRVPDTCEDIPLTPSQRQLLGLPPMSRAATPQEQQQYFTPPRFSRSNTPRSSSSSIRPEPSDSPLSGRGTPLDGSSFRAPGSASSFSPAGLQRTMSGSQNSAMRAGGAERRLSFTSTRSSPLSLSEFEAVGNVQTPTKGHRASMGLNNKWLYEKGKGSPRGSLYS